MPNDIMTSSNTPTLAFRLGVVDLRKLLDDLTLVNRLETCLVGAPWDVFSTVEIAPALSSDLPPMALNDWHALNTPFAPQAEPSHLYAGNVIYYRKDRLVGWAQSGGRPIQADHLWEVSADYLEFLGLERPLTLYETEDLIQWMLQKQFIELRAPLRLSPFAPFSFENPFAHTPIWGERPGMPVGRLS